MKKFIYKDASENESDHWEKCIECKAPYILVKRKDKDFFEVFYDVTNIKVDLDLISEEIKSISRLYKFFYDSILRL